MSNFAFLSYHTCPTAELGRETAGGMNVYINQVARELGSNGHSVDVFTRSHRVECDANCKQHALLGFERTTPCRPR